MTGMCVHCVYNACAGADVDCECIMKFDVCFESGSIKKRYSR